MTIEYTSDFLARYWAKIDCTAGLFECWNWTGTLYFGYGYIKYKGHFRRAHRIAYELAKSDPGNLCVLHACDNRRCCNPSHLFLGTPLDNSRDMVEKGRSAKGERQGLSVLTADQVREIRRLLDNHSTRKIAKMFGVSRGAITGIKRGTNWKHIL